MKYKIIRNFYLMNVGRWYFAGSVISEDDPGWKHIVDLRELYEPQEEGDAKDAKKENMQGKGKSRRDNPG